MFALCALPLSAQTTNVYNILNCQTTYGATGNGVTDDTLAIQRCINAVPATGGEVFLPAGKYRITASIQMGDGTATTESHTFGVHIRGAGVGSANTITANASEWSGGTSLIWGGAYGGTMLTIAGPTLEMRVSDIQLNANGIAGTGIQIVHGADSVLTDVQITNYTVLGISLTATNAPVVYGNCDITMTNVRAVAPALPGTSGMKLDGYPGSFDTCSSKFTNLELGYGGAGGSYGLELAYTDSNTFSQVTFRHGSGTGGNSILFSAPAGNPAFPYGNEFHQMYYDQPVGGVSGNNGNYFASIPASEGMPIPAIRGLAGISDQGELFGPFAAMSEVSSDTAPSLVVKTPDSSSNSAGALLFQWGRYGQNYRARVRSNYFDGLVFGTAEDANGIQDRWNVIDSGHLLPWQTNAYDIGSPAKAVRNIYVSGSLIAGGTPGITRTISVGNGNGGSCSISFVGGIVVASTC